MAAVATGSAASSVSCWGRPGATCGRPPHGAARTSRAVSVRGAPCGHARQRGAVCLSGGGAGAAVAGAFLAAAVTAGRHRPRVARPDGLGTVCVSLAEGLGPDAGNRFLARRAREEELASKLQGVRASESQGPERGFVDASRLRLLFAHLDFLRRLDERDFMAGEAATGEGLFAGPTAIEQLRGDEAAVSSELWNGLLGPDDSPFLEHGFLASLEEAGCVSLEYGWQPRFLLAFSGAPGAGRRGRLVGAVPLYFKMHSDGEFCEDPEWIEASYRLGVRPWPRLFVGVPFTPHCGRRFLAAVWLRRGERAQVEQALLQALTALSVRAGLTVNVAFGSEEDGELLGRAGFVRRSAQQAWWSNRQPRPYKDFDDFLGDLRVKNRRTIEKQRAAVAALDDVAIEVVDGASDPKAVSSELMADVFHACYVPTQVRHGNAVPGDGLSWRFDLNEVFFRILAERFAHRVLLVIARRTESPGRLAGGALFFAKGRRIYGRYWGCPLGEPPIPHLHFECCYHAAVEHAIRHGYMCIEPGNGGGTIYQVQRDRGFEPAMVPSYHWLPSPKLREAFSRLAALSGQELPRWTRPKHSAYKPAIR